MALTRWTFVCCVLVAQSCPTLWDPVDCRRLCPWDSPGKTTGVGCQGHSIICSSCLPGHRLHLVLPSLPNIDLQCCLFKAHDSLGALNKNGRNNFFKKSYCKKKKKKNLIVIFGYPASLLFHGLSLVMVLGILTAAASLVSKHRL